MSGATAPAAAAMAAASDKVKVAVRVRPFNKREVDLGTPCVVEMDGSQSMFLVNLAACQGHVQDKGGGSGRSTNSDHRQKQFTFDHCFDSIDPQSSQYADQEMVFNSLGKDILDNAFKGYNASIFAYGQTGSGKSYSMMGSQDDPGIIPRLCVELFQRIAEVSSPDNEATVEVSYMEIYNEKVHDLLDLTPGNKISLKVREHNVLGPYVDGLSQLAVISYQEIEDLIIEGNKSRTVAATNMNSESSRSHAVFTVILTFTLTDQESGVCGEKVSRISLVDLAGSERAMKTGAVGERLKEGSNINKSLTTLGLVISKLAEQSSGKLKDKFVPYRDSVLTWLLKDSLGGNSRTVMIATISPAADNYEETLSTLRYADRAKRIVNHAVVNEDPNARIIRELRAEVEVLKDMLLHAAQPEILKEKLSENEKLMREMSLTWEEKLHKTEQLQEDRRQALEKMGISVESSGIKVEKNKFFLVNLNADPSLNELLVYYLKEKTLVGREDASTPQDIQLSGLGIQAEHSILEVIDKKDLYISPLQGARTCVNGVETVERTKLANGDRLLWGFNHFFRVNCPRTQSPGTGTQQQPAALCRPRSMGLVGLVSGDTPANNTAITPSYDWRMAQEEVMMAESTNGPVREAMARLEIQYQMEKQNALENQRRVYEKQFEQLRQMMSPSTPLQELPPFSSFYCDTNRIAMTKSYSQSNKLGSWTGDKHFGEDNFKQSLARLREELVRANGLVREANLLAEEMSINARFSVTLRIPAHNLTPSRRTGTLISEPAILIKRRRSNSNNNSNSRRTTPSDEQSGSAIGDSVAMDSTAAAADHPAMPQSFVWSLAKLDHKLVNMREVYNDFIATKSAALIESGGVSDTTVLAGVDPYWEEASGGSQSDLVGVANIYLDHLLQDVDSALDYHATIISQQGEVAGQLYFQLERTCGNLPQDRLGVCGGSDSFYFSDPGSEESVGNRSGGSGQTGGETEDGGSSGLAPPPAFAFRIKIKAAAGIPGVYSSNSVYCQYLTWGDADVTTVRPESVNDPSDPSGDRAAKRPPPSLVLNPDRVFYFDHSREIAVANVTEEFLDLCFDGALSVEIYGEKTAPPAQRNVWEASQETKARSLANQWRQLSRKLELRLEIQELNEEGVYCPVELQLKGDDSSALAPGGGSSANAIVNQTAVMVTSQPTGGAGGVFQLRQGQQRRIAVTVSPVPNSGHLPLVCDRIVEIAVGSPCIRSKLQRPLDSYQEDDLNHLRERWSEALDRRRAYLDVEIQKYINKSDKTEDETEREERLVEQWVNLTEERNAVLAPAENSGVPGAPLSTLSRQSMQPGTEVHQPVLFLDLSPDDFSTTVVSGSGDPHHHDSCYGTDLESCYEEDNVMFDVPVYGHNSILPKEHGGRFFSLPIIGYISGAETNAVASWDSSIHDSIHLNRVTDSNERAYLIVKVVVRLSHPKVMDLVLRKRICFNVFKKHSLTDKIRRRMSGVVASSSAPSISSVGVVYEIVSSVPKASEELEDRESLAVMAAITAGGHADQEKQQPGADGLHTNTSKTPGQDSTENGETFIEKYTKGIAAVDETIKLDRLRQRVAIKEHLVAAARKNGSGLQLLQQKSPASSSVAGGSMMRKTFSVPNIRNMMKSSMSLDSLAAAGSGVLPRSSESFHDLNVSELANNNTTRQPSTVRAGDGATSFKRLPMSMTMSTLHEERLSWDTATTSSKTAFKSYSSEEDKQVGQGNNGGAEDIVEADVAAQNDAHEMPNKVNGLSAAHQLGTCFSVEEKPTAMETSMQSHGDEDHHVQSTDKFLVPQIAPANTSATESAPASTGPEASKDSPRLCSSETASNGPTATSVKAQQANPLGSGSKVVRRSHNANNSGAGGPQRSRPNKLINRQSCPSNIINNTAGPQFAATNAMTRSSSNLQQQQHHNNNHANSQHHLSSVNNNSCSDMLSNSCHSLNSSSGGSVEQINGSCGADMSSGSSCGSNGNVSKDTSATDPKEKALPDWLVTGESIQIRPSNLSGQVRFIGSTEFAGGTWVGVELDTARGKNDGSVEGVRYFSCPPKRGMFVRPKSLKLDRRGRELRKYKSQTHEQQSQKA